MQSASLVHPLAALILAPVLPGVINKTKAFFAGRAGPPLLQGYYDLSKLLRKGAVFSRTTSWVFRAAPLAGVATTILALFLVPLGHLPAVIHFDGDLVLLAYLLGLGRFFTVIAALDTGSSFEGMGASREVQLSALAEPVMIVGLFVLALRTHALSLTGVFGALDVSLHPAILLIVVAWLIVFLAENARIPFDDPNTHLELTMIHEVMVLDNSGPDLAFVHFGAALKLWVLGALVLGVGLPVAVPGPFLQLAAGCGTLLVLMVGVGIIESSLPRLRLARIPHILVAANALCAVALLLVLR